VSDILALRRFPCGTPREHDEHEWDTPVYGPGVRSRCPGARVVLGLGLVPGDVDIRSCGYCYDSPVGNALAWTTASAPLTGPCPRCGVHYEGPVPQ